MMLFELLMDSIIASARDRSYIIAIDNGVGNGSIVYRPAVFRMMIARPMVIRESFDTIRNNLKGFLCRLRSSSHGQIQNCCAHFTAAVIPIACATAASTVVTGGPTTFCSPFAWGRHFLPSSKLISDESIRSSICTSYWRVPVDS